MHHPGPALPGCVGADIAARRYGPQNTAEFHAELLARRGRIEELHALAAGTRVSAAARPYVTALEDLGRAGDAEAYLHRLINTARYPTGYHSELLELLLCQGRFDDLRGLRSGLRLHPSGRPRTTPGTCRRVGDPPRGRDPDLRGPAQ